jgi:integrase
MKTRSGTIVDRDGWKHLRFRFKGKPDYTLPLYTKDQDEAEALRALIAPKFSGNVDSVVMFFEGLIKRLRDGAVVAEQEATLLKLAGAWRAYVTSQKRPPSSDATLRQYAQQLNDFAKWCGKDIYLQDVRAANAEEYARHLDTKVSSGTVNKHLSFLRLLWRVVIPGAPNPWNDVKSQRVDAKVKRRHFTVPQLKAILNKAEPGEFQDMLFMFAYGALRLQDTARLRIEDVLFDRGVIDTLPAKTCKRGDDPPRAKIGIHTTLEPILRARCAGRHSGYVFPEMAKLHESNPTGIVVRIQQHLRACGIATEGPEVQGRHRNVYGSHSFRHTLQTMLVNAGVHKYVIDVILAHKDPSMGSWYSHISDAQVIEAINKAMPDLRQESGVVISMVGA